MATVFLPSSLDAKARGARPLSSPGGTVREVLSDLEQRHPDLQGWILDEQGRLRPHVALILDQDRVALDRELEPGDELHVVQADSAFVIPLTADVDRVTAQAKLRVYGTRDRGATWQSRSSGLPQNDAYLTFLRQAFCHDGRQPLGLYFGAESGEIFSSVDGGDSWTTAFDHLPPIVAVRCSR